GGGGDTEYGPYQFGSINQSDGMLDSPLYAGATLYYPIDAPYPYSSIILGPGWSGAGSSMAEWANLFASHGFIAVTIDYNDPDNDSHQQRAEAMVDLFETIRQENTRTESPVFNQLDTNKFAAAGYSLSGGVVQIAAMLDSTLDAVIALNPTIIFEDCEVCADFNYCICLVPEFLDHNIPTLIIAGENEINELPDYAGLLGPDIYENTPETTAKMLYEIASGGHGSAAYPGFELVQDKALNWVKYHLMADTAACDMLLQEPDDASQFLTTLECASLSAIDLITLNPNDFLVKQNYPNPFNPITSISFSVPIKSRVEINVYDIMGNEVDILLNDVVPSGIQSVSWDAKDQSSGIYFIRMLCGNFIEYKKAILLK
ncbi:T9SS type A sorting domain-containing protein, partial [Candidatus Marinimicrobia bacterium]|nr:T9SS type A sorting domain-containing protein [Candidatus Neomarinimicrobiota bacterium]